MMMKKLAAIHRTKQTKGKKKTRLLNTPKKKLSNSHLPGTRRPPSQALLPRPRPRQPALRRLLRRPPRLPAGHRLGGAVQRGLRRREGARRGAAPSHRRRRRLRLWRPLDEAEPADAARGAAGRAGAAVEGVRLREAEGGRGAGAGGRGGKRGRGRGRRSCGRNCGDDSRCSSSFFDRHCHHHDDNHNSNTTTNYFLLLLPPFLPQRLRPPHQRPATPRQPHFKAKNWRRRIVTPSAAAEFAYVLKPGGRLYTITDVEDLGKWMAGVLDDSPMFRRLSDEELAGDAAAGLLFLATEEGQKVARNGGRTFRACYERLEAPRVLPE